MDDDSLKLYYRVITEEYEDPEDEDWDEEDPKEELEYEVEVAEQAVPYNEWEQKVSSCVELMTDFQHSIETVGFYHWWMDWWKEGRSPEEAARQGLIESMLLEDD